MEIAFWESQAPASRKFPAFQPADPAQIRSLSFTAIGKIPACCFPRPHGLLLAHGTLLEAHSSAARVEGVGSDPWGRGHFLAPGGAPGGPGFNVRTS